MTEALLQFLPPWQMLLVAYAIAFFLQNKCDFLWGRFKFLDRLLECSFCCGGQGGVICWGLSVLLLGEFPVTWEQRLGSFLVWVLASAGSTFILDTLVRWFEGENT
jgi:hypothetical protein